MWQCWKAVLCGSSVWQCWKAPMRGCMEQSSFGRQLARRQAGQHMRVHQLSTHLPASSTPGSRLLPGWQ